VNWLRSRIESWRALGTRLWREPAAAGAIARESAVALWSSRGGGFYGLGYLITFVILEVRMFVTGIETSDDVVAFLGQQMLEMFLRIAFESLGNVLQAFLWPLLWLSALGNWGIAVLIGGWWGYGRFLAPRVARWGVETRRKKSKEGAS
jgi:hypothetical protein